MRLGEYPGLSPTLRWIITLAYTQPVNQWETGLFKKTQIIKKQSRALSRSLISEYPGYSLISEPITAREKHYSLVGYMLTVDIYFLWSNQSARKVLFTCLANTKFGYKLIWHLTVETRLAAVYIRYGGTVWKNYPRILQVLIFPYTTNSNPGCTAFPRAERNPGKKLNIDVAGSGVGIETNVKRIGRVSFLQNSSLHNFWCHNKYLHSCFFAMV